MCHSWPRRVYNAEDCLALELLTKTVIELCRPTTENGPASGGNVLLVDSLARNSLYRTANKEYALPGIGNFIKAAYWDYSRSRIYIRSSKRIRRSVRQNCQGRPKAIPINQVIKHPPQVSCPKCHSQELDKGARLSKVVFNLKYSRVGIKRWTVKHEFQRFICRSCKVSFHGKGHLTRRRYGWDLMCYCIHQTIEERIPQSTVARCVNTLFGLKLSGDTVGDYRRVAADKYRQDYKTLFDRILAGRLMHVDETKVRVDGKDGYVWVFTNLEEVVYVYARSREADALYAALSSSFSVALTPFKGVMVSDFYSLYDSLNCAQQKCLIHLTRDNQRLERGLV
jgi:hypothetical protein